MKLPLGEFEPISGEVASAWVVDDSIWGRSDGKSCECFTRFEVSHYEQKSHLPANKEQKFAVDKCSRSD